MELIGGFDIVRLGLWIIEIALILFLGILLYKVFTFNKAKKTKLVQKQAYMDQLTGRGNRYLFLSILDKLIKKGKKFAVCFMDLDGFKQINDTMGHDAGDELLISLANTFETKLPKNSTAYRLGGDEFAIVIENINTVNDITTLLDNLKKEFEIPFIIENSSITLEYSLGVAMYPEDANNRQDLIMYADDAMYYIKEHGKNDYYFHNKALRAQIENNNKMEKDLKIAYAEHQFGFSLQPRIDVLNTKNLCFEALLYWKHPVLGKINSDYFIKQAENMALIVKLDQYILGTVCDKLVELKEAGITNVHMAVNISNKHATRKEFIDKLAEIISSHNIEKGSLQIELISDVEIKKIENYKMLLERLREVGATIIVNNLEIKYKALSLFKELPIDELKLLADYAASESNLKKDIFKNVVELGKSLDYKITVSRIEQEKELIEAIRNGADKIQGNFLFKAMEEDLIIDFINGYGKCITRINNIIDDAKKLDKISGKNFKEK